MTETCGRKSSNAKPKNDNQKKRGVTLSTYSFFEQFDFNLTFTFRNDSITSSCPYSHGLHRVKLGALYLSKRTDKVSIDRVIQSVVSHHFLQQAMKTTMKQLPSVATLNSAIYSEMMRCST